MEERRFPLAEAEKVAEELIESLNKSVWSPCQKVEIGGSVRRRKPTVGDIELVIIPAKSIPFGYYLFRAVETLIAQGVLQKRLNKKGNLESFTPNQQYVVHVRSGIPVDIFTAEEDNWGLTLLIRTGPAEFNRYLMASLKLKGYAGHLRGIEKPNGDMLKCPDEEAVFKVLGWDFIPPERRK